MGVDIRVWGRIVEVHGFANVSGRDALHWAEVVKDTAQRGDGRVFLLCDIQRGIKISPANIAAACRACLTVQPSIGGTALVSPQGFERMLARVSVALTNPPYEVGYFDDLWKGRDWLAKLAGQSTAA